MVGLSIKSIMLKWCSKCKCSSNFSKWCKCSSKEAYQVLTKTNFKLQTQRNQAIPKTKPVIHLQVVLGRIINKTGASNSSISISISSKISGSSRGSTRRNRMTTSFSWLQWPQESFSLLCKFLEVSKILSQRNSKSCSNSLKTKLWKNWLRGPAKSVLILKIRLTSTYTWRRAKTTWRKMNLNPWLTLSLKKKRKLKTTSTTKRYNKWSSRNWIRRKTQPRRWMKKGMRRRSETEKWGTSQRGWK